MSRVGNKIQEKFMSMKFRRKEIFKPLNTGRIDEHVSCVREYVANIFFYTKNGRTIMIDAGYNYERLEEKMRWLDIDPNAPYDGYDESDDTEQNAKSVPLTKVVPVVR